MPSATVAETLASWGTVFAVFDTQDSGHVSYGVQDATGARWFVKTSGDASVSAGGATNAVRRDLLRGSVEVSNCLPHDPLVPVEQVLEAPDGVLLVSRWYDGELLRKNERFAALPAEEVTAALDVVIDLHVALAAAGWVSGDLYDGCLMYDFTSRTIKVIDFECYRRGAYVNDLGRLPGSTRFMAPEEHTRGATVDERTTVFNLGRMVQLFLAADDEVAAHATQDDPADRPQSLAALQRAWRRAHPPKPTSLPSGSR